ncbi:MAG: hypothetical protein LBO82_01795, partial [Synergistaceae bacterium]|nr:hypothetical protein [Synergistaceae bacterium]
MLKFRLFSGKSARKMELLALVLLLLAAAPRAWGGFEITDSDGKPISPEGGNYTITGDNHDVLSISNANGLQNAVISGEGKSIDVSGSDVNLTLKNLTVSADSDTALKLNVADNGKANIEIDGTVTLSSGTGNKYHGFWISSTNGFVVLNAVSEDSILRAIGNSAHGLYFQSGNSTLLLQGDGKFDCVGGWAGEYDGLACYGDLYVGGSVTLSAAGSGGRTSKQRTFFTSGSFTLFENAKVIDAYSVDARGGGVNIMGSAFIAEDIIVNKG